MQLMIRFFSFLLHLNVQVHVIFQIHFGESSMQRCEIMLNDLIESKRTNTNIKATINQPSQSGFLFSAHIFIYLVIRRHSLTMFTFNFSML